jgi:hypothetical protein
VTGRSAALAIMLLACSCDGAPKSDTATAYFLAHEGRTTPLPRAEDPALQVSITQRACALAYSVTNRTAEPFWVWLDVPSGNEAEFQAGEAAWVEDDGDLVLFRKTQAQVETPCCTSDLFPRVSRATRLEPGQRREGELPLADRMYRRRAWPRDPADSEPPRAAFALARIQLEVGFLPLVPGLHIFKPSVDTDHEYPWPLGERFSRSAVLNWTPCGDPGPR